MNAARRWWWALLLAGCVVLSVACERTEPSVDRATLRSEVVTIVADDSVSLVGELVVPSTSPRGDVDAVIVLGGSGAQDRDGSRADLPGYRPLYDVAQAVAAVGVTSLRLDERGVGASGGQTDATTSRTAADVGIALQWLRTRLPGAQIGIIGHSEGGLVALMAAVADTTVRTLVLLATPSRTGREIARWQRAWVAMRDVARFPPESRERLLRDTEAAAERQAERDPWMREWFALDPRVYARRVRGRVLVLHGTRDYQVPVEQANELAAALGEGGTSVEVRRLPNVNHLLLADTDGDPDGYVRVRDRTLGQAVVGAIKEFVTATAYRN